MPGKRGPGRTVVRVAVGERRAGVTQGVVRHPRPALQELGSSGAMVCTPSFNVGAVATYKSAGLQQLPEIRDQCRDA